MTHSTALRVAVLADRLFLYQSMACSDATPEMMGLPQYPDHPIPDYETFCEDFTEEALAGSDAFRQFIVTADDRDIGAICYTVRERVAELDIWIASRKDWGRGHGRRALTQLIAWLEERIPVDAMIMRPSARNERAIAVYGKAGFEIFDTERHQLPTWCLDGGEDYFDPVVMVRPAGPSGRNEGQWHVSRDRNNVWGSAVTLTGRADSLG
ncbi:MAG: GNAT family protein [Rhodobacteraceae bacterium]|nr:GNAT family protein [Paracoccaceae bacterium]